VNRIARGMVTIMVLIVAFTLLWNFALSSEPAPEPPIRPNEIGVLGWPRPLCCASRTQLEHRARSEKRQCRKWAK
jgi:hypothetical protein